MMVDRVRQGINEVIGDKRDRLLHSADNHGARNVRVFGSVARGEADLHSDVDLLVEWDLSHISPWGGAGFDMEAETLLSRNVDVVTLEVLHPLIRQRVLSEGVAL